MSKATPRSGTRSGAAKESARARLAREQQAQQQRKNRRILAIVAIGIVLLLVAGGIGFQAWRTSQQPVAPSSSTSATPVQLVTGKPVVFGSADAPVRIALYEDFHCPACAGFEEQYASVLAAAEQEGRAAVEFYPMSFHDPGSVSAGNAFACAAEAGFGHAYYTGLFDNAQLEWNDSQLITLAEQVTGTAPPDSFRSCVTERRHTAWLQSITAAADAAGVKGTPTMFLDGVPVDLGALTPAALTEKINAAAGS